MKKIRFIAFISLVLMLTGTSCISDLFDDGTEGGTLEIDELVGANTDFDMAQFITETKGQSWKTSIAYYKYDDDDIWYASSDLPELKKIYGSVPLQCTFGDNLLQVTVSNNGVPVTSSSLTGAPEDGSQFGDARYYFSPIYYEIDLQNNTLTSTSEGSAGLDVMTILSYDNGEKIILDWDRSAVDYIKRIVLVPFELPECLKTAGNYTTDYFTDWVEYFEKYDTSFVEDAEAAYEAGSYSGIYQVVNYYNKKWGTSY